MKILAGDVGGTKTYLTVYERTSDGKVVELQHAKFVSNSFHGLAPMLRVFLGDESAQLASAVIGVAGPVENQQCKATNLPWRLDARKLEAELGIARVSLINDFHAVGLGVEELEESDVQVLQEGVREPAGATAIVGAGTGLGECITYKTEQDLYILPSEGGHSDFAPRNPLEIKLLEYLLQRHSRVSYERVVSGPGLVTIYEFLVTEADYEESPAVREKLHREEPARVIGEMALGKLDPACQKAVELFVSLYAAEAGNLALKLLPARGVFLAGGIAPKLVSAFQGPVFLESFKHKGRMSRLLDKVHVAVVMNRRVGLLGARAAAWQLADKDEEAEALTTAHPLAGDAVKQPDA